MDQPRTEADHQPEIQFRPLSEGLGFHPFSDGLPYAPVAKAPRVSPSVSATMGQHLQPPLSPALSRAAIAPRSPIGVPEVFVPVASAQKEKHSNREISTPLPKKEGLNSLENLGRYYLLRRFFAYSLDMALNTVLSGLGLGIYILENDLSLDVLFDPNAFVYAASFLVAANWIFVSLQEVLFKTSIGKYTFGLCLRGRRMQCLLRAFCFIPSTCFLGVGLWIGLFDVRKRFWHDQQSNLQPLEILR